MTDLNQLVINSQLSNYSLRTKQAEEIVQKFLFGHPQFPDLVNIVKQHMAERAADRVVHLESILKAVEVSLNLMYQTLDGKDSDDIKNQLVAIIKAISTAINHNTRT